MGKFMGAVWFIIRWIACEQVLRKAWEYIVYTIELLSRFLEEKKLDVAICIIIISVIIV